MLLLISHPPQGSEPVLQRKPSSMEYCPCCNGGLIAASATHQEASSGRPATAGGTLGATEPGWPPESSQICPTRTFCGEPLLEFGEGFHTNPPLLWLQVSRSHWSQVHNLSL